MALMKLRGRVTEGPVRQHIGRPKVLHKFETDRQEAPDSDAEEGRTAED